MRLPSRRYFCISLAPLASASLTRPSMKSALLLLITGVMVQLSCTAITGYVRSRIYSIIALGDTFEQQRCRLASGQMGVTAWFIFHKVRSRARGMSHLRLAHRQTVDLLGDHRHQLVGNTLQHQHQLHSSAALPAVAEATLNDVLGCQLQVGILAHNAHVLPAQFHLHPNTRAQAKQPVRGPTARTYSPKPQDKGTQPNRACSRSPGWAPCQPSCRWTDLHAKNTSSASDSRNADEDAEHVTGIAHVIRNYALEPVSPPVKEIQFTRG